MAGTPLRAKLCAGDSGGAENARDFCVCGEGAGADSAHNAAGTARWAFGRRRSERESGCSSPAAGPDARMECAVQAEKQEGADKQQEPDRARTGAGDGSGERRGIGREDMKSVSRGSRLCGASSLCTVLSSASGRCGQGVPPARLPGEAVFCRAAARGLCESAVRTISPGHSAGARERRHRGGSADLGGRGSVERLTGQSGAGWGRGRSAAGWPVRIRKVALGAGL